MHTCVRTVSGALLLGPRPIKLEQYTQCQNSKGWAKYVSFIATLWQYHVVKIGITKPVNFAWVRWADTVVYFHMNFLPLCVCVAGGLFFFSFSLSFFLFFFPLFFPLYMWFCLFLLFGRLGWGRWSFFICLWHSFRPTSVTQHHLLFLPTSELCHKKHCTL